MQITIPEVPISQLRMRHRFINGVSMTYDPQAKEKKKLKEFFKSLPQQKFTHPHISVLCYFPIPKATRKRDLAVFSSGLLKHEKKPDIDNILKFLLDCMDGIFFDGDQSVSLGICMKLYHTNPRTEIYITESKPLIDQYDLNFLKSCTSCLSETSSLSGSESPLHQAALKSVEKTNPHLSFS